MLGPVAIAAVSIYCVLSHVLRKFPWLIHGRKKLRFTCRHISHRGGAGERLENTMSAFDHAAALGTDMFELDCHLTKDGYVVVCHDHNLSRMCGQSILISETNFKDLPPLLTTQRLDFNHKYTVSGTDTAIILLEDLFKRYPNMPMNIDIKHDNRDLMLKVNDLIVKYKREHITVWGSGKYRINKQVKEINDKIGTLFSLKEILLTLGFYYTGLLPFLPLCSEFFEVPMFSIFLDHFDSFPEHNGRAIKRIAIRVLDYLVLNKSLIKHLRLRGVPSYVFVLNSEKEWKSAAELGASGIMTDFPAKLRKWIDLNIEYFEQSDCKRTS